MSSTDSPSAGPPQLPLSGLPDSLRLFARNACTRGTMVRAVKVACVVTPVLTVLNHAREFAAAQFDAAFWLQVGLTFLVPYCVSTYSSAMAAIAEQRRMGADPRTGASGASAPPRA